MKRSRFVLGGVAATLVGCAPAGPVQRYAVLDASSEPLRSRFTSANGKVRVLMLVSPT